MELIFDKYGVAKYRGYTIFRTKTSGYGSNSKWMYHIDGRSRSRFTTPNYVMAEVDYLVEQEQRRRALGQYRVS